MSVTAEQARAVYLEADCLYTREEVEAVVERMAADISEKLADKDPIVLCVMTGAVIPAGILLARMDFPLRLDYIHATRYGGDTVGGSLEWIARPSISLRGRTVLVLDDILDEGLTLAAIVEACRKEGAAEVYSAVLVEKRHDRKPKGIEADFVGLEIEDRYVFGYGMDYKGYLRNAPGIFAVKGL